MNVFTVQRSKRAVLLCGLFIFSNSVIANDVIFSTFKKQDQPTDVRFGFNYLVDPIIDVHPFGTNNVLNLAKVSSALTFSGRTQVNGSGQTVKLQVDGSGFEYLGSVDNSGNWSVILPPYALNSLTNGNHNVTITTKDALNNQASVVKSFVSSLTAPVLTLNMPFTDGYLSVAESTNLAGRTLSGAAGDAASVSVVFGGQNLVTSLSGGIWTATLTPTQLNLLADGTHQIVITATDAHGNATELKSQAMLSIKSTPTLSITAFAGLDGLNFAESRNIQSLSGTSTGLEVGREVTITLNGKTYGAKVLANGTWSTTIPSADLRALANTVYTITAKATDRAGNPAAQASVGFNVNLAAPPIVMVIDPIAGDDMINAAEMSGTTLISGRSIGPSSSFTAVSVNIGSAPLVVITDANGFWSTTIPTSVYFTFQGNVNITATSLDATLTRTVLVETVAPTLTINSFTGNGILNAVETNTAQTITGTASTTAAGQLVTVTLNGKTYFAQVSGTGPWSTLIPAADLNELEDGSHSLIATVSTKAGNVTTQTQVLTKDTAKPTASMASTVGSATATSPIPFTVTFSKPVSNFTASNLGVVNGTVNGFSGSGNTYNFTVLPTGYGYVAAYIAAAVTTDLAGNQNAPATAKVVNYIDGTLPVDLVSFTAKADGNAVRLNWTTQSESNNQSFTLLRADENLNFKPITSLDGKGTTQAVSNYSYLDRSPMAGTNYYQLVQTDFNGLPKLIATRAVDFKLLAENEVTLYPNPATTELRLKFTQATSKIELIDLNGRIIKSVSIIDAKASEHSFDVADLPRGTYFIKLYQLTGYKTVKFVKY